MLLTRYVKNEQQIIKFTESDPLLFSSDQWRALLESQSKMEIKCMQTSKMRTQPSKQSDATEV